MGIRFLIVAIVAGVLGFGGATSTAAATAQIPLVIFIVLFLAAVLDRVVDGRRPPTVP